MDFVGYSCVVRVVKIICVVREHGRWQLDAEKRFGNCELETTTNVSVGLHGDTYTIVTRALH